MNWYLKVLKQYFDFRGRARRREYWMFTLINTLVTAGLALADLLLFGANFETGEGIILYPIYALLVFIPSLAVAIRRLHDTGRRGWYLFTFFVPILGPFIVIYYLVVDSEAEANRWGENPKKADRFVAGQLA